MNKQNIKKKIQELKDCFGLDSNVDLEKLRRSSPKWLGTGGLQFEKTIAGVKKLYIDSGKVFYAYDDKDGGILESCIALIEFFRGDPRVEKLLLDFEKEIEVRRDGILPKQQFINFELILIFN